MRQLAGVPLHVIRRNSSSRVIGAFLFAILAIGCAQSERSRSQVDERVAYYSRKTVDNPGSSAAYAQLGAAYLDKTRSTHDPAFLEDARRALHQSLEIQPNFLALKSMAAVCNYCHRFEDALRWGRRAAEASPPDTAVTAMLVEAYLSLGRNGAAAALLPARTADANDFHTAAALGRLRASQGRYDEAVEAYQRAAQFARKEKADEYEAWAQVMTAGTLIDSGRLDESRSYLRAAALIDPHDELLRVHQAELAEQEKQPADGLAIYESLLRESDDPEIHARANKLARSLGESARAAGHFSAAERGFKRAMDAGEVHTFGALARLYLAGEVHLEEALELAKKNLEYRRDREARLLYDEIVKRLSGAEFVLLQPVGIERAPTQ